MNAPLQKSKEGSQADNKTRHEGREGEREEGPPYISGQVGEGGELASNFHPGCLRWSEGGRERWGEEIINCFFRIGCFSGSVGRSVGVGIIGKVRKGLSLKKGVGRREGNPQSLFVQAFRPPTPLL